MPSSDLPVVELEHQYKADIRAARVAAGAADAEQNAAAKAAKQAHHDRKAAAEAKARGEAGADEALTEATERWTASLARIEQAKFEGEAAARVVRSAQARLSQLRQTEYDAFVEVAEAAVAEVREAAGQLLGPLRLYLRAWDRARAEWAKLNSATQQHVINADRERGQIRGIDRVWADAALPTCPIEHQVVMQILNTMPRPRYLNDDHEIAGDDGVTITDAAPTTGTAA